MEDKMKAKVIDTKAEEVKMPKKGFKDKLKSKLAIAGLGLGIIYSGLVYFNPFEHLDYKTNNPIKMKDSEVLLTEPSYALGLKHTLTIKRPDSSYVIIENLGKVKSGIEKVVLKDPKGKTLETLNKTLTDKEAMKVYGKEYNSCLDILAQYNSDRKEAYAKKVGEELGLAVK